jgi:hypothetical protein
MSHEQDTRGRSGAIGLAAAVTIVGLASGCGSTPSTTVPNSSVDGPTPTESDEPNIAREQGATTPPETDTNPEAGGEQDIPADGEGERSNPGSVRG